nr:hypothetical protein [Tanacetum cinerariifolium]
MVLELADRTISKPTGVAENVFVKVEEIENFLNDDSIPIGDENSKFNIEEDIIFLERLLSEEPCPNPPMIPNKKNLPLKNLSTHLLVPIPHECKVTSDNGSESIEPVKEDSSVFMTFLNLLFDNNEINSNELESHVESTSNYDTVKFDNLDEFFGPLILNHIAEEERIKREHADYISRMEMLFTINPRPHPTVNANINVESIPSSLIPIQDNDSQREEIDIVTSTDDVLPPCVENDDSDGEVDAVDDLLARNTIVEFECIDARVKFDDKNNDHSYFIFVKVFSLLSAESEDTIFDPGISN